tara:strand:- start:241 stop:453 length:213 start_codon:yes stop_codon:yes gene_type:complete
MDVEEYEKQISNRDEQIKKLEDHKQYNTILFTNIMKVMGDHLVDTYHRKEQPSNLYKDIIRVVSRGKIDY